MIGKRQHQLIHQKNKVIFMLNRKFGNSRKRMSGNTVIFTVTAISRKRRRRIVFITFIAIMTQRKPFLKGTEKLILSAERNVDAFFDLPRLIRSADSYRRRFLNWKDFISMYCVIPTRQIFWQMAHCRKMCRNFSDTPVSAQQWMCMLTQRGNPRKPPDGYWIRSPDKGFPL